MCNKKQSNRSYSREVVDFIVKGGIKHVCISPGSRNTPLTESFINHKKIKCFSIFDERSSCYYALGLAKTSNSPVAIPLQRTLVIVDVLISATVIILVLTVC